jgi:hypothetical protein
LALFYGLTNFLTWDQRRRKKDPPSFNELKPKTLTWRFIMTIKDNDRMNSFIPLRAAEVKENISAIVNKAMKILELNKEHEIHIKETISGGCDQFLAGKGLDVYNPIKEVSIFDMMYVLRSLSLYLVEYQRVVFPDGDLAHQIGVGFGGYDGISLEKTNIYIKYREFLESELVGEYLAEAANNFYSSYYV